MSRREAEKKGLQAPDPKDTNFALTLDILGYREEGAWVALALEMDIRGYGETFDDALEDLRDLVVMQISFAHYKGQPEMIWKPAERVWFDKFEEVRRQFLSRLLNPNEAANAEFLASGLGIPPAYLMAEIADSFAVAHA